MKIKGSLFIKKLFFDGLTKIFKNNENKVVLETEDGVTQLNVDNVVKYKINGFITNGDFINQSPSTNGFNAGEKYCVNHQNHNYNGNVYLVTEDDTWKLLDTRKRGLGVYNLTNLVDYYFTSESTTGWWNDNFILKQDKPQNATQGNVAIFDANKNAIDSGKKISTSVDDDENAIPTSNAIKQYVDNNGDSSNKVKVSSDDATADYLENKLEYGYFDTNPNDDDSSPNDNPRQIVKGFYIVKDYSGIKVVQNNPKLTTDYIVSNEAELDAALYDIGKQGIGGSIFLLKGVYDKGSAFSIPNITGITLRGSGLGTKLIRPDNDNCITIPNAPTQSLVIEHIYFYGKSSNNYGLIAASWGNNPNSVTIRYNRFENNTFAHIILGAADSYIYSNEFISGTGGFNAGQVTIIGDSKGWSSGMGIFNNIFQLYSGVGTEYRLINLGERLNDREGDIYVANTYINNNYIRIDGIYIDTNGYIKIRNIAGGNNKPKYIENNKIFLGTSDTTNGLNQIVYYSDEDSSNIYSGFVRNNSVYCYGTSPPQFINMSNDTHNIINNNDMITETTTI